MITLVMNPGLPEEQLFPVPRGKPMTIGRTKDNQVSCLHKSLSRKHAQLVLEGTRIRVTDLQSKNGIFYGGKRVAQCVVGEGESFRCGDINFLVEGATTRSSVETKAMPNAPPHPSGLPRPSPGSELSMQTLPSPIQIVGTAKSFASTMVSSAGEDDKYKERLFLLIRASELCVSELSLDAMLDELMTLTSQALPIDRIALLALDENTLQMAPRVVKSFTTVASAHYPYSIRVIDWVVDHGSPASFVDVSRDRQLPGNAAQDASILGAMCVPLNPGGGTIGVIYVDSLAKPDCFRPDDLALLRAIANLTAVAIESAALRGGEPKGRSLVPSPRSRR